MKLELYEHQKRAVEQLHSGCILCGGVGSGKSRAALAYYYIKECDAPLTSRGELRKMRSPRDLYVITTAHKRDSHEWEEEMAYFLLSTDRDICWNPVNVVVDSWNNLHKYTEIEEAFFIFDEQRVVGSGAWVKAFLTVAKSNHWILLSATPGDTWSDYIPVFIANGFYKNRTEFYRKHVIFSRFTKYPKIERYINTELLEQHREAITVEMPVHRDTIPHRYDILVSYDSDKYKRAVKNRWDPFLDEPINDAGRLCYVLRKVVNSDESRLTELGKLLSKPSIPRAIIFYNFDYELDALREFLGANGYAYSEWNGHKHQDILDVNQWVYLVQYTAGAEGWNCTSTNVVIFFSLNYSYKVMVQAAGRINRIDTEYQDLHYYVMQSNASIDVSINKALSEKKEFNERSFSDALSREKNTCL